MSNFKHALGKIPRGVFVLSLTLLVVVELLPLTRNLNQSPEIHATSSFETTETRRCNIYSGNWTVFAKELYYDDEACPFIIDKKQRCIMAGRPDREYLKYRWKPRDCELPLFDATQFLKLVRGKSMAFVGDSMARNQLQSLLCLLNSVTHFQEVTASTASKDDNKFSRWWLSADYNFNVTILWSPFLVKSVDADPNGGSFNSIMNLYLDEADKAWARRIENFDYVIISTGQWFYRPLTFYENGQVVGCQKCHNMPELNFYGYKKAFQTTFKTIINLQGFEGLTFLVTQSPKHFENGDFNTGGFCERTKPFTLEETQVYQYGDLMEALYRIQVEEFAASKKEARKKGLHFGLIDITHPMAMRPDGHPGKYGRVVDKNVRVNDCVHWCLPGPVDTWNEFLLYMIKMAKGKA